MENKNTPEERKFFDAIMHGKVDSVREQVASNPELLDSYDYNFFGATPITRVCFLDDRPMMKALIDLGADVDRRSDWDMGPWSPLHSAVTVGNSELAEFLLEHGATMDVHTAAGLGRIDDLKTLLNEDSSRVAERGGDGCHPLHFAGSIEAAQLLLDHGADMEARCIDHYSTPVQYLAKSHKEVANFLFECGAKADIFSAIMAENLDVVENLIAQNPDALLSRVNQEYFPPGPEHDVHNIMTFTIGGNSTPLHACASANRPSMIKPLVDAGLSPDIRGGYDDSSALHQAAWNDYVDVAKELLNQGANIDLRSGEIHNNSPAGWAIVAGSADVFVHLIDHGATILEWFTDDARKAVKGEFRPYKIVPQENYERILRRLENSSPLGK